MVADATTRTLRSGTYGTKACAQTIRSIVHKLGYYCRAPKENGFLVTDSMHRLTNDMAPPQRTSEKVREEQKPESSHNIRTWNNEIRARALKGNKRALKRSTRGWPPRPGRPVPVPSVRAYITVTTRVSGSPQLDLHRYHSPHPHHSPTFTIENGSPRCLG